jgi:LuxR family maltose regulon positive regulatory protein
VAQQGPHWFPLIDEQPHVAFWFAKCQCPQDEDFQHTTQARGDPQNPLLRDVLHLLDRLLVDAQDKARMGSALEIFVLQALAQEAQGDQTRALTTLERALVLAASEGYIRVFVDEGKPVLILLREIHARGIVLDYVATLLSAFGEQHVLDLPSPLLACRRLPNR